MLKDAIGIGEIKKAVPITKQTLSETPRRLKKETPENLSPSTEEKTTTETEQQEEGQLSVDVYQTNNKIIIIAPVAGVSAQELNISLTDDIISIHGKRNPGLALKKENFITQECFWGTFSRSIILPENVDTTKIKASFKNSILKIEIPKTEDLRTKIIQIKEER